jgi:hypothetical protein
MESRLKTLGLLLLRQVLNLSGRTEASFTGRIFSDMKLLLRQFIKEAVLQEMGRLHMVDLGKQDQQRADLRAERDEDSDRGPKNKINTAAKEFDLAVSNEQKALQKRIEELTVDTENQSIEDRIEYALEEDDYTFDTAALHAIAINIIQLPNDWVELVNMRQYVELVRDVKKKLLDSGLTMKERPAIDHSRRGPMSNAHGRHPFAGTGGGGSGMGSSREGPTGFGMGGGPGAIGSKTPWSSSDSKNLPMGSRSKRT